MPFGGRGDGLDLGARGAPRVGRARVGRIGGDDEGRPERGIEQRPVGRNPTPSIEHHPHRRARGRVDDTAHGQRGPVGDRRTGTDHDRLRVGAQLVRVRRARRRR